MFDYIFKPILRFVENLLTTVLKVALLISAFFIIYLGIRTYFAGKNFSDIKKSFLFLIIGLILILLVLVKNEIIIKVIETFVPEFK